MVALEKFSIVMAEGHSANTSNKFAFIPTTRVIDILERQEWLPAKASEKRVMKEENRGFQTHMIRFRKREDMNQVAVVGEFIPEIVLKNAHDGTASFSLMAGIYRFVCKNGAVVADSTFSTHKIKHIGFQDQNVIDAVFDVVKTTPLIMGKINDFKQITLSKPEQIVLAESAMIAKYGADNQEELEKLRTKFNLESLVLPTRYADTLTPEVRQSGDELRKADNSLWNTFNILQEKLVEKGGRFAIAEKSSGYSSRGSIKKARGITSVTENIRVNQALWALAERMSELKG